MILSVSRRTDIPAFYAKWFMNRVREGSVMVRNPMNWNQVSSVSLDPKVIDCIVFWTKNAAPLLPYTDELEKKYSFYFQYTLNAYGDDIEPYLQTLDKKLETFGELAEKLGPERVIWRYDPVLITDTYTVDWHIKQFERIAKALQGRIETCVFSFIDIYPKVVKNVKGSGVQACTEEEMDALAKAFSETAARYGFRLRTCAENIDLDKYGIEHGCCVDRELIQRITHTVILKKKAPKDKNQRQECGCIESIDIGQYNTCRHGCRYCYANFNPQSVKTFSEQHRDDSPLLVGVYDPDTDKKTERKMELLGVPEETSGQLSFI